MSEQACANRPDDTIELNGHRYVSEAALASWGIIEVMARNPSVSEVVSDLEARLEKAEAERDQLAEQQIAAVNDLQTARNDALEEASNVAWASPDSHWGPQIAVSIQALKDKS